MARLFKKTNYRTIMNINNICVLKLYIYILNEIKKIMSIIVLN